MSRLPVLKGTLDLLVLRALSWSPMHGFEIVSWLERAAGGSLEVDDSALYQAVYRLEERGLLAAEWGVTENNRRARYYKITPAGRAHLRTETKNWMKYARDSHDDPDRGEAGTGAAAPVIRAGIRRAFDLALRRRDRWEREVEDEIKLHLALRAEQLAAAGCRDDEAYAKRSAEFGPLENREPGCSRRHIIGRLRCNARSSSPTCGRISRSRCARSAARKRGRPSRSRRWRWESARRQRCSAS